MQERFSLLRKKNQVLSMDEFKRKQKKTNKKTIKTKDPVILEMKKKQNEESDRLSFPKCVIPNCAISAFSKNEEIRVETPIVTQSRAELEKRYLNLYEQYEDVFYEKLELENQKKSILLEVASIKKQEERLKQLLEIVKKQQKKVELSPTFRSQKI